MKSATTNGQVGPIVEARGLWKRYRGVGATVEALRGVDVQVMAGQAARRESDSSERGEEAEAFDADASVAELDVQIRTLQRFPPPIRILAPGDVARRDFFDASHAPVFSQIMSYALHRYNIPTTPGAATQGAAAQSPRSQAQDIT